MTRLVEVARKLTVEHGPAARIIAYRQARAKIADGEECEGAMWLEVVRLTAGMTQSAADPAADVTAASTPEHAVVPFRRPADTGALAEVAGLERRGMRAPPTSGLVVGIGMLTVLAASLGAATLTLPNTAMTQHQSSAAVTAPAIAPAPAAIPGPTMPPRPVAVAEAAPMPAARVPHAEAERLPNADSPIMTASAVSDPSMVDAPAKPVRRVALHKQHRKLVRHDRTVWDRITSVFR